MGLIFVFLRNCYLHIPSYLHCRMGGNFIAMLRVLRLREPLVATVSSAEFRGLRAFENIAGLILNPHFWTYWSFMVRAMYPFMRILRLADRKIPGMDKLYYYVLQADRVVPQYLTQAEEFGDAFLTEEVVEVFESTKDAARQSFEESEYDDAIEDSKDWDQADEKDPDEEEDVLENIDIDSDDEDEEDFDSDEEPDPWLSNSLCGRVMSKWRNRRSKLCHAYSLVGFMLCPIPTIFDCAKAGGVTAAMQEVCVCYELMSYTF